MIFCYPQPGKLKAKQICQAFADGCGGTVIEDGRLRNGPAVFYGISPGMESLWRDARDFWFIDNAYFDAARGTHYRVTKNRLQHTGTGTSDGQRFAALGIEIEPWRDAGSHLLLCPQSDHFMRAVARYEGNWVADTLALLKNRRPVRVRPWARDKREQAETLTADLAEAFAVVTWSSAAAVTAILAGIPAVCSNQSAAWAMAATIPQLDNPPKPEREQWCGVLADNQFTLDEMRNGVAWERLND